MKTLIRKLRRTVSPGWTCQACRIHAGDPSRPFDTYADASDSYDKHVADSHGGVAPIGTYMDEFTYRT